MSETIDVLAELRRAGALLLGHHFVYKSGKHGSAYINLDPLFPRLDLMTQLCAALIEPFQAQVETVAAPAVGGITLALLSAQAANKPGRPVAPIWADKSGDQFGFERAGFKAQLEGKAVVVVEDLLTTGNSVAQVCRAAEQASAKILGVSAICNRGGITAEQLAVARLHSLAEVNFAAVDAADCEQCKAGVAIVADVGHGSTYRAQNPQYHGGYVELLS